jgi:hypothetical protein
MLFLRNRISLSRPVFLLTALLMVILAVPALSGEESVVDGVTHVANGAEPAEGRQKLQLEEVWRAGGLDDEETVFGIINKVLTDDENNIYLLDAQLSEISVFSPEGELLNTLGREGDGPGEFRGPTDMCFLPDGTIGVLQAFPGKVIKLNHDNTEAGTLPMGDPTKGAFYIMQGLREGGGRIITCGTEQHIDQVNGVVTRETFISNLDDAGIRDKTFTTNMVKINLQEMRLDEKEIIDSPARRFDVTRDGKVVVAIPRNEYEVSIFNADGTLARVFSREYESWERDERATGIWQRILETVQRNQAPGAPISIEKTQPDVEFMRVADDGSIWILNSRAMWTETTGAFTYYDVFSPEGHFVKQVEVVCEGNPQDDILIFAGDDLAFMITGFWDAALARFGGAGGSDDEEAEPMSVICYKIR